MNKRGLNTAKALLAPDHDIQCNLSTKEYYGKDEHQNEAGSKKLYGCTTMTQSSQMNATKSLRQTTDQSPRCPWMRSDT